MTEPAEIGRRSGLAAWGGPIARLDGAWQKVESRLCAGVLVAEVASLTLWILLKGLSSDYVPGGNGAGLVTRGLSTAAVLGAMAHVVTRRRGLSVHRATVAAAIAIGLVAGRAWAHAGVAWSSNVLNWLQNASVLMLIGGLRGLATRLTLWLALLGASLATSRAKHIHVDVLARYLPSRLRKATAVLGWLSAALVCAVGVVGFVDYISIAEFRASAVQPCPEDPSKSCDTPPTAKAAAVQRAVASDFFLLGRQASLDARSALEVLAGRPYDQWMTAEQWNAWLGRADWAAHYGKAADALRMNPSTPNATRMPQVTVPGSGEEARGLLIRELNFVFPFGLAVIAVKFFLRALLLVLLGGSEDSSSEAGEPA